MDINLYVGITICFMVFMIIVSVLSYVFHLKLREVEKDTIKALAFLNITNKRLKKLEGVKNNLVPLRRVK